MPVTRHNYLSAPDGDAIHVSGQCYTHANGRGLIESVTHHAFDGNYYFTRALYRRSTPDGVNWNVHEPVIRITPEEKAAGTALERTRWTHARQPGSGLMVSVHATFRIRSSEPQFASDTSDKTYRVWFETSRDHGQTWSAPRPLIHRGDNCDETQWAPGITYGRNGAYSESFNPVFLDANTFIIPLVIAPVGDDGKIFRMNGGYWYDTAFARGTILPPDSDASPQIRWHVGERLRGDPAWTTVGVCEPDLLPIEGQKLFTTLRTQGHPGRFPSARFGALSTDGGRSWSPPALLRYDDGSPVFVPASFSAFLKSPRTGRAYWFANILDHAVEAQYPRCPLCIAEFDMDRLCIIRESVRVIQGLPPGAPPCTNELPTTDEECGRQYTNFDARVDRDTGDFVITVPEMPRTTWREFTSDCIQLRVTP